jgi:hypothetical protein
MYLNTPKPKINESLFSYILRLTNANYYNSPWDVYRHLDLTYSSSNPNALYQEKITFNITCDECRYHLQR